MKKINKSQQQERDTMRRLFDELGEDSVLIRQINKILKNRCEGTVINAETSGHIKNQDKKNLRKNFMQENNENICNSPLLHNCPYPPEVVSGVLLYFRDAFKASCHRHGVSYYRIVVFISARLGLKCHEGDAIEELEKRLLLKLFGNEDYSF